MIEVAVFSAGVMLPVVIGAAVSARRAARTTQPASRGRAQPRSRRGIRHVPAWPTQWNGDPDLTWAEIAERADGSPLSPTMAARIREGAAEHELFAPVPLGYPLPFARWHERGAAMRGRCVCAVSSPQATWLLQVRGPLAPSGHVVFSPGPPGADAPQACFDGEFYELDGAPRALSPGQAERMRVALARIVDRSSRPGR